MNRRQLFLRSIRQRLRFGAVDALSRAASLRSIRIPPLVHVLLLHEVLECQKVRFREWLDQLATQYTFLRYGEAVDRVIRGAIDRPYLAFSFDDGLFGCWHAAEILEEYDARGMFFVCPTLVNGTKEVQDSICRERLWIPPSRFLSWNQIELLAARGHEFGNHTQSHIRVSEATPEQLIEEVLGPQQEIEKRLGTCKHFAWPYGRFAHLGEPAMRRLAEFDIVSCASGERGCHGPHQEPVSTFPCIRRESVDLSWPTRHVEYFLGQSSRSPLRPNQGWPSEWSSGDDVMQRPKAA